MNLVNIVVLESCSYIILRRGLKWFPYRRAHQVYSYLFLNGYFSVEEFILSNYFQRKVWCVLVEKLAFRWNERKQVRTRHMCIKSLIVFYLIFFLGTVIKIICIVKFDLKYKFRQSNMNIHPLVWNKIKRWFFFQPQATHIHVYIIHISL